MADEEKQAHKSRKPSDEEAHTRTTPDDTEVEVRETDEVATTSDATTRVEGQTAAETPADPSQGPHSSDAGPEAYPFPTQGDVDVETIDPGSGEGEYYPQLNIDDWVVLDGSVDEVEARFDNHRAVILEVRPQDPVKVEDKDDIELTVRTRDEANATFVVGLDGIKEVIKGGLSTQHRG